MPRKAIEELRGQLEEIELECATWDDKQNKSACRRARSVCREMSKRLMDFYRELLVESKK